MKEAEETARQESRCEGSIELSLRSFAISAISRSLLSRDLRFARVCRSYFSRPPRVTHRESPHPSCPRTRLPTRSIDRYLANTSAAAAGDKQSNAPRRSLREIQLFRSAAHSPPFLPSVFLRQLYRCPTSSSSFLLPPDGSAWPFTADSVLSRLIARRQNARARARISRRPHFGARLQRSSFLPPHPIDRDHGPARRMWTIRPPASSFRETRIARARLLILAGAAGFPTLDRHRSSPL